MPIPVKCPNPQCRRQYNLRDELAGKKGKCPACGKASVVRAPQEEAEGPRAELSWEYVILSDFGRMGHVDEKRLNRMGREGWELVSVFRESEEARSCFYFKRRLKA